MIEKYILRESDSANVRTRSCATMVSGTKGCGKSTTLFRLFSWSVKTKNGMAFSPLLENTRKNKECLSQYELIILGKHPFNKLSWTISTHKYDVATLILLSYFVNICISSRRDDTFTKLKFEPLSAVIDNIAITDPDAIYVTEKLYRGLVTAWDRLQEDKEFRDVIPAEASLINVFDVGPSRAAQDFLPFLNKYCKRSLHLTCYNETTDADKLQEELSKDPQHEDSRSNQLLKQLKGCVNEEQAVIVTSLALEPNSIKNENALEEIRKKIKGKISTEKVKKLMITEQLEDTKVALEKIVLDDPFYLAIFLREILLLQTIKKKSKSFWMKRTDIEELSEQFKFKNGSFDRFLRVFTSFGSIFYTHDIPALDDFVIIDIALFVERTHQLYQGQEDNELSKYGLFKQSKDKDIEIIFKYLKALGIAVEVKSKQIDLSKTTFQGKMEPYYCYIPSARSIAFNINDTSSQAQTTNELDSIVISFNDCIAENLQACLCNEALRLGGFLKPTENPDTTVVRVRNGSDADIEITDIGKGAKLTIKPDAIIPNEKKIEIFSRVLLAYPSITPRSGYKLRYQIVMVSLVSIENFIDALKSHQKKQDKLPCKLNKLFLINVLLKGLCY